MTTTELKQKAADFTRSEPALTGLNLILIGAILLLTGICIGLLTAPLTHGISLFSHNGNNNGNNNGNSTVPEDSCEENR